MEKKTLGTFLGALRKASGMTQKQLADKLNVSDKAVSRWERDESAPDLTLIPVIAEVFGVTSDELLRGERNTSGTCPERAAVRTEKQLRRLIKDTITRFHTRSIISAAVAFVGLIAAMIGNSAFLRAYIGFLAGCIFFVAAGVCEIIFLIQGLSALDNEDFDPALTAADRKHLIRGAEWVFGIILLLFSFCLPLIILIQDAYMGLQAPSWIASGLIFAAVAGVLIAAVSYAVNIRLGIVPRPDLKSPLGKLRIRCVRNTLILVLCLGIGHISLAAFLAGHPYLVADHREFHTLEAFRGHMETPVPYGDGSSSSDAQVFLEFPAEDPVEEIYAHIDDTEPLVTFIWRNHDVTYINYGEASNSLLPIRVMSSNQVHQANRRSELICAAYCITYAVVLALETVYYQNRKKKLL